MRRALAALLALLPLLAQAETLQVATGGFRPIAYLEDGHPKGEVCDILTEAAHRAGLSIEFHFMPWARALEETETGRIDAIFPLFRTAEREGKFVFPAEILLTETMSWFARADSPLQSGPDLTAPVKQRIGFVNRTTSGPLIEQALAQGLLTDTENLPSLPTAVQILAAGRIDLVPSFNQGFWAEAQHQRLDSQIKELSPPLDALAAYLAFSRHRDHTAEIKALDTALKAMREDGTYQKIQERYSVTKPQ